MRMMATETSSTDITDRLFGFLVDYDNGTQQYEPELAKSWEVSPDGVTWTFHLRKGAAFSDGHPMTAEDVLFSFEVRLRQGTASRHAGDAEDRRAELHGHCAGPVHDRHKHAESRTPACSMRSVRAVCRSSRSTCSRSRIKNGTFAAAYNVSTPPEKLVTSGAWRVVQYVPSEKDRARPQSVLFRVRPEQAAAAVSRRAGLSRRARPGRRRSEVPLRRRRRLDDVKPENYRWYEENQENGNFTLYDLGPSQSHASPVVQLEQSAAAVSRREAAPRQDAWASHLSIRSSTMVQQPVFPAGRVDGHRSRCADHGRFLRLRREELVADRRARTRHGTAPDLDQARLQPGRSQEAARRHRVQGHERRRRHSKTRAAIQSASR